MANTAFTEAPEARNLAEVLMAGEDEFTPLLDQPFLYVFCTPAPVKKGKAVYATAEVLSGKNALLYWQTQGKAGCDAPLFRIVISQDLWSAMNATQREWLLRHELRHCAVKKGRPVLKPHDFELFLADLSDPAMDIVCDIWQKVKAAQPKLDL